MERYDSDLTIHQVRVGFDTPPNLDYSDDENLINAILDIKGVIEVWINHGNGLEIEYESESKCREIMRAVDVVLQSFNAMAIKRKG